MCAHADHMCIQGLNTGLLSVACHTLRTLVFMLLNVLRDFFLPNKHFWANYEMCERGLGKLDYCFLCAGHGFRGIDVGSCAPVCKGHHFPNPCPLGVRERQRAASWLNSCRRVGHPTWCLSSLFRKGQCRILLPALQSSGREILAVHRAWRWPVKGDLTLCLWEDESYLMAMNW